MSKSTDIKEIKAECEHTFKIIRKSGVATGFALWKCTKCPKIVQSS